MGEIGKSLQDIAPTRNLPGKIKEKYGGLKKFLERYPEDVVICADHPFNPHVFLRKPLSSADLDLIGRGIIPPHLRKVSIYFLFFLLIIRDLFHNFIFHCIHFILFILIFVLF